MSMSKLYGIAVLSLSVIGAACAQNLVDKLRNAGNFSFRLTDVAYQIKLGPLGGPCNVINFAQGNLGAQNPLTLTFQSNSLNFQAAINQMVNSIQSNAVLTFVGMDLGNNVVEWTVN